MDALRDPRLVASALAGLVLAGVVARLVFARESIPVSSVETPRQTNESTNDDLSDRAPAAPPQDTTEFLSQKYTPQQLTQANELCAEVRARVSTEDLHPCLELNAVNGLRFLIARDFDFQKALELYVSAIEWRETEDVSKRTAFWRAQRDGMWPRELQADFVLKHWMTSLVGPDKNGVLVHVVRLGTSDPAGLVREANFDDFVSNYVSNLELVFEKSNVLPAGCVEIFDLRMAWPKSGPRMGASWDWFTRAKNSVPHFVKIAKILERVYPERTKKVFIIGAPRAFSAIWAMVTPFVPKSTKKKVKIYSSMDSYLKEISKEVDLTSLPDELGGEAVGQRVHSGMGAIPKGALEAFKAEQQHK